MEKYMKKDLLVVYKGGLYDGCIWEWCFFSYDKDGIFHNIYTSGSKGIKTEEEACELMKTVPDTRGNRDSIYIYDLTKDEDINDFQDSYAVPHVVKIVELLNAGEEFGKYSNELYFVCDECEEKITGTGCMEDWHGCGGIEMTADKKLCEDCHSNFSCSDCGEYVGEDEISTYNGMCENCYKNNLEAAVKALTGKNYYTLEYNHLTNTLTEIEMDDDVSFVTDLIKDNETAFDVKINCKNGIRHYIIDAASEYQAIDIVAGFLNNDYYTADAELINASSLINA
jgi:hypothetical protein